MFCHFHPELHFHHPEWELAIELVGSRLGEEQLYGFNRCFYSGVFKRSGFHLRKFGLCNGILTAISSHSLGNSQFKYMFFYLYFILVFVFFIYIFLF